MIMETNVISTGIISALWAVFAGCAAWVSINVFRSVTYVTLADGRKQERSMPFVFRLLLPLTQNLSALFGRPEFRNRTERINRKIVAAGFSGIITAEEFLALRVLVPLVAGTLLIGAFWAAFAMMPGSFGVSLRNNQHLFFFAIAGGYYAYPGLWLNGALKARHREIQKALPFVLDLLTLSVEAGLDFMNAMQRIVERRKLDALCEEFVRVLREIQLGKTRRDALRDMAERVDHRDVQSVINALVQADELGVGIAVILRIQSDQMRQRRFERAERLANEAPVKMLFPLIVFIFPAVFMVLLGPIILQALRQM
jgi:tight adherence protein C